MKNLEIISLDSGPNPQGLVIWLHGLGADGHDFEPIVPLLELNQPLRFQFPNAPVRPVTINGGMEMRSWYDIDANLGSSVADIEHSSAALNQLIDQAKTDGFTDKQIVLAGFSQGGVIAMHSGLRHGNQLAGIMALSTYLNDPDTVQAELSFESVDTPVFMAHGQADAMIPLARGVTSRDSLLALNYSVEWHDYPMGHEVCHQEIQDIATWLNRVFA